MSCRNNDVEVYIGLGSNVGAASKNVYEAFNRLSDILTEARLSSLYTTEPQDFVDQPDFINAACYGLFTGGGPYELLSLIHNIEASFGRNRSKEIPKGPRTIDIDILLFGRLVLNEPESSTGRPSLVIPHKRLRERRFALVPLLELEPALTDPAGGKPFRSFLDNIVGQEVVPYVEA